MPEPSEPTPPAPCYLPHEIAQAAQVSEGDVLDALGLPPDGRRTLVRHDEAVRVGRALYRERTETAARRLSAASIFATEHDAHRTVGLPFAVSSTLHAVVFVAVVLMTTLGTTPTGAMNTRGEPVRLVFVGLPGPGGGGGGGGLRQTAPPPAAEREGRRAMRSPVPERTPPAPTAPEPRPAPLHAESLPVVVAPLITLAADSRTRVGALEQTTANVDSHGAGDGGGVGTGTGTGVGEGEGSGVGPGSGGGTGGGPYRAGSGIQPPRLLHEVKPGYTEEARVRHLAGDVILEIVVRRDGTVGDLRIVRGLGGGLNERATQAVRQWRFAPARRQGQPVDVVVEVAVEFRLR